MMTDEATIRDAVPEVKAGSVVGGIAMFGGARRKLLGRLFWVVLSVGMAFELGALFILVRNALTIPA